jgi:prepilin-type N-terminal cleavage/methylation domain-containing protein
MRNKKGFTLIELLVVIAIIGLLSTLAVVSLNSARGKARDARRISDVKTVQTALELYKSDHGEQLPGIPMEFWISFANAGDGTGLAPYLPSGMPVDPINSAASFYTVCIDGSKTNFIVAATLENTPPTPGLDTAAWAAGAGGSACMTSSNAGTVPTCDGVSSYCVGSMAPVAVAE